MERVVALESKNQELQDIIMASVEKVQKDAEVEAEAEVMRDYADEDDEDEEQGAADGSDLANLFSYCVETAIDSHSPMRVIQCLLNLSLLLSIQIVYAYGYFDASALYFGINEFPAFAEEYPPSLMYSTTTVGEGSLTLIKLFCSLCSLMLLSLLMKNDNEGSMLTTSPMSVLLAGDGRHMLNEKARAKIEAAEEEALAKMSKTGRMFRPVLRVILLLMLQIYLMSRQLILPMYACFGAACNFAASIDAQEIVLNSVAIGFVFELDDWLYEALLNKARRSRFEERKPRPMSPLSPRNPRGGQLVSNWCWVCFALDIIIPAFVYFRYALPKKIDMTTTQWYTLQRTYILLRATLFIVARLHVSWHCGGAALGTGRFCQMAIAMDIIVMSLACLVYSCAVGFLDPGLGNQFIATLLEETSFKCLFEQEQDMPDGFTGCWQLALMKGIPEQIREMALQVNPPSHYFAMAWGADVYTSQGELMSLIRGESASGVTLGNSIRDLTS